MTPKMGKAAQLATGAASKTDNAADQKFTTLLVSRNTKWTKADKAWFEKRPSRSFRLRELFPGELPAEFNIGNAATHVVVRQVAPGFRDKRYLSLRGPAAAFPRDDLSLMYVWQNYETATDDFISLEEIFSGVARMGSAGGVQ